MLSRIIAFIQVTVFHQTMQLWYFCLFAFLFSHLVASIPAPIPRPMGSCWSTNSGNEAVGRSEGPEHIEIRQQGGRIEFNVPDGEPLVEKDLDRNWEGPLDRKMREEREVHLKQLAQIVKSGRTGEKESDIEVSEPTREQLRNLINGGQISPKDYLKVEPKVQSLIRNDELRWLGPATYRSFLNRFLGRPGNAPPKALKHVVLRPNTARRYAKTAKNRPLDYEAFIENEIARNNQVELCSDFYSRQANLYTACSETPKRESDTYGASTSSHVY